jgi:SAM-dependent methyltransferase
MDFHAGDFDFEAAYRHGDLAALPWVIGEPQPAVVALVSAGEISGSVLDVGCGTGDNALYLASQGYDVTGIDCSASAVSIARERAPSVTFAVGDATRLDGYAGAFDTVVDSALYHHLTPGQRESYVAAVHRASRPGARLHLLCFADDLPAAFPRDFRVGEPELLASVGAWWRVERVEKSWYLTSQSRDRLAQAINEMVGSSEATSAALAGSEVDSSGRILLPVLQLAARRE